MYELRETAEFSNWIKSLRDAEARARINQRLRRLRRGNPGDVRPIGEGLSELRIDYGPGFRVYYMMKGDTLIIILAGGDKASQPRDINRAKELARHL